MKPKLIIKEKSAIKGKSVIKEISLSTFGKLEVMYTKWVKKYDLIVILSLRLSCEQLLAKVKGDTSRILVIDCVSNKKHPQSIQIASLTALTSMALAVSQVLSKSKVNLVVIDSLSSLIVHNENVNVLKFANDLSQKARKAGSNLIFPVLRSDRQGKLATIDLYVDKVEEA
jgi:hypothetical protein